MAIVFNGSNQYAHAVLSMPADNAQGPTTLAFFVKPQTPGATFYPMGLYETSQSFWMFAARGEVSPNLSIAGRARTIVESITAYTTITDNAWLPVVVTNAADGTCTAYVGTTTGVSANAGAQSIVTYDGVSLGAFLNQGTTPSGYMPGKLAYSMIYNRVWTAQEISDFINATSVAALDAISTTSRQDRWDLIADGNSDAAGVNLTLVGTPTFDADDPFVVTPVATPGIPSLTLKKDGVALGNLTGVQVQVVAGSALNGSSLYYTATATTTAGVMAPIDLSATAAAVSDPVVVKVLTAEGESIAFTTTVADIS